MSKELEDRITWAIASADQLSEMAIVFRSAPRAAQSILRWCDPSGSGIHFLQMEASALNIGKKDTDSSHEKQGYLWEYS
jgi:hypothetical protein